MARIRTFKPEMFQDEKLAALDPLTRFVFAGLISMADDAGRLVDNVKSIDGFIFPETEDTAKEALKTLARLSRILRYVSHNGQRVIQIVNWDRHQKVDHPNKHVLPPPSTEVLAAAKDASASTFARELLATPSREARASTSTSTSTSTPTNSVLSEPAGAAPEHTRHTMASVMGLVVEKLYFGIRPDESQMKINGSVLKKLHEGGRSWDYLARVVEGLGLRRDRGEIRSVKPTDAISCKWLSDKDQDLNQLAVSEDAVYKDGPGPPGRRRSSGVAAISDLVTHVTASR